MSEKFTYIDFLMYVVPGLFFASVLLLSISLVFPSSKTYLSSDFLSGIIFLIFSFILGNLIQVHSHRGPEDRLKKEYWSGLYPSQIMFFADNKVINEVERKDLINTCIDTGIFDSNSTQLFESDKYEKVAVNNAQKAFNYIRVFLADEKKGGRIHGAEGYYLFLRGLFVASFWSAISFLIVSLLYIVRLIWPSINKLFGTLPSIGLGFVFPLLGVVAFIIFWRTFRYRCRGTAQGFAREVYRAYCAHKMIKDEV